MTPEVPQAAASISTSQRSQPTKRDPQEYEYEYEDLTPVGRHS